MVYLTHAHRFAVEKQFDPWCVRIYYHVYDLSFVEIPVRQYMDHRVFPVVGPCRLVKVEIVLFEARRVYLPEIRIFREIRRRFAYIVKARPYVLAGAESRVPVLYDVVLRVFSTPGRGAVVER